MQARLGIAYKNFAAHKGVSHIGLGVAALNNALYLNKRGQKTTVFPVRHNIDIMRSILDYQKEHKHALTHFVISAPWLSTRDLAALVQHFHSIQWVIVSHSNVGFLQADPNGIDLLRDYIEITNKYDNLTLGGNSLRFVDWVKKAYNTACFYLPNLYSVPDDAQPKTFDLARIIRDGLRIGSFGAVRPLKNQLTAAAAAILIGRQLEVPVEFHLSAGREEGGGNIIVKAIEQMTRDLPGFTFVRDGWRGWIEFRELVDSMDLLIHPSYTESFNIVTADGISQGVPTVGSEAIHWLPESWRADSDDANEIARVGLRILSERSYAGIDALRNHNERGFKNWERFLDC